MAALCAPGPAWAMHIADGILPPAWAAGWWLAALPFLWLGIRDLKSLGLSGSGSKPFIGLIGAATFIISCMPVPVPFAGTTSHPCGTGLAAVLIGPRLTVVVASVALALQAIFLAHGGISTMGANLISMGVVGAFAGMAAFRAARALGFELPASAFAAGLFSDWATYASTAFQLALALHGDGPFGAMFGAVIVAFVPTQLPLGIIEGFVSAAACRFIIARRPELLRAAAAGAGGK